MHNGVWFDCIQNQSFAVLVEEGRVVEIVPTETANIMTGDIFRARIERLEPSLQAAFIHLGSGKNGFLPLKAKAIETLKTGDTLLVQVKKEAVGEKGPLLTTELTFPGRWMVLIYGTKGLWFSRKLVGMTEEKKIAKTFATKHLSNNEGLLFRTAGLQDKESAWEIELDHLREMCRKVLDKQHHLPIPQRLYRQDNQWEAWLEKSAKEDFEVRISDELYRATIEAKCNGEISVRYCPEDSIRYDTKLWYQLQNAFRKTVHLPGGGNIVIEPTEALTVIDVNSAKHTKESGQQETALATNLEAVEALAWHMRLRNLHGIIVVDFIKMLPEGQRELADALRQRLCFDRVGAYFIGFTTLGLAELTRKRQKMALHELNTDFQRIFY